jgi:hypothetical protein
VDIGFHGIDVFSRVVQTQFAHHVLMLSVCKVNHFAHPTLADSEDISKKIKPYLK